uniref:Secreted protein n=1 Tax=Octopus bimaculoides TaxID=37653 RepID=A0A0L8HF04_OCTBM
MFLLVKLHCMCVIWLLCDLSRPAAEKPLLSPSLSLNATFHSLICRTYHLSNFSHIFCRQNKNRSVMQCR